MASYLVTLATDSHQTLPKKATQEKFQVLIKGLGYKRENETSGLFSQFWITHRSSYDSTRTFHVTPLLVRFRKVLGILKIF